MAVAMAARRFTLELDGDASSVKEVFNFTMMPGSLPIRLQARA
jgi:hypothetical protein